jgi:hypothetical protein
VTKTESVNPVNATQAFTSALRSFRVASLNMFTSPVLAFRSRARGRIGAATGADVVRLGS